MTRTPADDRLAPGLTTALATPGPRYTGWTIEDIRAAAKKLARKHIANATLESHQAIPLDNDVRDDISTLSVRVIPDK